MKTREEPKAFDEKEETNMVSTTGSIAATQGTSSAHNKILINGKLVEFLATALNQGRGTLDKPISKRDALNFVVRQMGELLLQNPVYCKVPFDKDSAYEWFDSDEAKWIHQQDLRDKGRFVEACIIAYLWGEQGLATRCVNAREVRPRQLTEQQRLSISRQAAAMQRAKDVESSFVPTTFADQ